jgi:hypothetical protein
MSKLTTAEITCQSCGKFFEKGIYISVNSKLDPVLREKILNGEFFKHRCDYCDYVNDIFYEVLYHDMTNNFMVWLVKPDNENIIFIQQNSLKMVTSIQLEMLIYLKFWEADMVIKKLYQLVRLLDGKYYDWYFKVCNANRETKCTGKRQDIIRKKIRDKIKPHSTILYDIIKETYITQIRNSIAHSNYSFLGRNIHLNNHIKNDSHANIRALGFDKWIDMFHNTISLFNEYIRMNNIIHEYYSKIAANNNNVLEVQVTEKNENQYPLYVEYIPEQKRWMYKQND